MRVDGTPRTIILNSCAIDFHGIGRLAETMTSVARGYSVPIPDWGLRANPK